MKLIINKLDNGYTLSVWKEENVAPDGAPVEVKEVRKGRFVFETKEALDRKVNEILQ